MSLELTCKPDKTKLRVQEDVLIHLDMRNTGLGSVSIEDPLTSTNFPRFHVLDRGTGETKVARLRKERPVGQPPNILFIAPGETYDLPFYMSQRIGLSLPGTYEITAECSWNDGQEMGRAEPFTLTIEGSTPSGVRLVAPQNPHNEEFEVFWVDLAKAKPEIMRSTISNYRKPEVSRSQAVTGAPSGVIALPSTYAAGSYTSEAWLVWIKDRVLTYRYVPEEIEFGDTFMKAMPESRLSIVGRPFFLSSQKGEVLLWMGALDGAAAKLQLAGFNRQGECEAGEDLMLDNQAEPLWSRTAFLSTRERRAYFISHEEDQVRLGFTRWTEGSALGPLIELAARPGRFAAAGFSVLDDDSIAGLLLTLPDGEEGVIDVISWTQDAAGSFEAEASRRESIEGIEKFERGVVRVNMFNEPSVAVKPVGKPWHISVLGEPFEMIAGQVGETDGPFELFLSDNHAPLILHAVPPFGLFFALPSGFPATEPASG